jgi:hypothetical protein
VASTYNNQLKAERKKRRHQWRQRRGRRQQR